MDDELIGEIRALLKNGEVPVRVSNRMLWAAFAEHYKLEREQTKQMKHLEEQQLKQTGRNTTDIKWIKRSIGGLFTALLAFAAIVFGA